MHGQASRGAEEIVRNFPLSASEQPQLPYGRGSRSAIVARMPAQAVARVLLSRGQAERAQEELTKVQSLPRHALVWASLKPSSEADRVKILLGRGDIASAEDWISEYNPGKAETPVTREVELVSLPCSSPTAKGVCLPGSA